MSGKTMFNIESFFELVFRSLPINQQQIIEQLYSFILFVFVFCINNWIFKGMKLI